MLMNTMLHPIGLMIYMVHLVLVAADVLILVALVHLVHARRPVGWLEPLCRVTEPAADWLVRPAAKIVSRIGNKPDRKACLLIALSALLAARWILAHLVGA